MKFFIKANGRMVCEMEMVNKFGLLAQFTKDNGKITWLMGTVE
jgi:hypothetical protein